MPSARVRSGKRREHHPPSQHRPPLSTRGTILQATPHSIATATRQSLRRIHLERRSGVTSQPPPSRGWAQRHLSCELLDLPPASARKNGPFAAPICFKDCNYCSRRAGDSQRQDSEPSLQAASAVAHSSHAPNHPTFSRSRAGAEKHFCGV